MSNTEEHRKALDNFQFAAKEARDNYSAYHDDQSFKLGKNHWTPEQMAKRKKRPTLVVNKVRKFVDQVVNDERLNSPSIKVRPVDSVSDPAIASILESIISHIEYISDAKTVYSTAYDCAVSGGIGMFRVVNRYAHDDAWEQDLYLQRIPDPTVVLFDPMSKEYAYEDARFCFVSVMVPYDEFKDKYPNATPVDFDSMVIGDKQKEWYGNEKAVRIAEYWYKREVDITLVKGMDGKTYEVQGEDEKQTIAASGVQIIAERKVKKQKVFYRIMSGKEWLTEEREWPGRHIPIIPVLGRETFSDGKRSLSSLIRDVKDTQRMYNYWASTLTEQIALQPKAPYMVTPSAIAGHEHLWDRVNDGDIAYLVKNDGTEMPHREPPPMMSAGMGEMLRVTTQDLMDIVGIYQSGLGQQGNERSAKAIFARQRESDIGTFAFVDNLRRSIRYLGKILVDLIPHFYDTERVIRIRGQNDQDQTIVINIADPATGKKFNDVSLGKYDVVVDVGPSYSTQRQEASESIMQIIQAAPNLAPFLVDLVAKMQSFPYADEVYRRIQQVIQSQMGPKGPTTKDLKDNAMLQNHQLDAVMKQMKIFEMGGEPPQQPTSEGNQMQTPPPQGGAQ